MIRNCLSLVRNDILFFSQHSVFFLQVDTIVACSSSEYLCKTIIVNAGAQVLKEYSELKSSSQFPGTTSGGVLPCKKIFFVPWSSKSHDPADVKSSLSAFISEAFTLALTDGYRSIG